MSTQLLNSHLYLKRRHVHNILILAFDMTTLGTLNQWELRPFSYEKVTGGCEGCDAKSGIYISQVLYFLPK